MLTFVLNGPQALTQLLRKRREAKVNNPSAFLTQAIKAAEIVNSSAKIPTNKVNNTSVYGTNGRPSLCQSANQLLGWLHKEGLKPAQLDEASLLYLGRCSPATQTKVCLRPAPACQYSSICNFDSQLGVNCRRSPICCSSGGVQTRS